MLVQCIPERDCHRVVFHFTYADGCHTQRSQKEDWSGCLPLWPAIQLRLENGTCDVEDRLGIKHSVVLDNYEHRNNSPRLTTAGRPEGNLVLANAEFRELCIGDPRQPFLQLCLEANEAGFVDN